MKPLIFIFINCFLLACQSHQDSNDKNLSSNPIFHDFNQPIDFKALEASHISEATESIKSMTDQELNKIFEISNDQWTFENTMLALDNLYDKFGAVQRSIYLMAYTNPDSLIRTHALEANVTLEQYLNKVQLSENLYQAVKSYSQSDEVKDLSGPKAKFVKETVEGFERNGFALSREDREKLKTINDQLAEIGNEFSGNIAAYQDHLVVSENEITGLPDDYKNKHRQEDGTYKIGLSYPAYQPFMKYSTSDEARKKLYFKFRNRAADNNLEVLQNLLRKRKEMVNLLGHDTYAAYRLQNRMAKSPEIVWEFEKNLVKEVRKKAQIDYQELLNTKKSIENIRQREVFFNFFCIQVIFFLQQDVTVIAAFPHIYNFRIFR